MATQEINNDNVTGQKDNSPEQLEFEFDDDMNSQQVSGEKPPEPKRKESEPKVENKEDEFELEVIDDTPEEDRGREPLPEDIKKKLDDETEDAAEKHSEKVEQRIKQLRKAYHDERREKETHGRQLEEATRVSQQLLNERNQLRQQLSQGESWALTQAKRAAELEVDAAKREYREAYEAGEAEKMANAQERLSRATSNFDQVSKMKPQYTLQDQPQEVYNRPKAEPQQQPQPQVDQKTLEWGDNNPWYGDPNEPEMNSFALGVHQRLIKEGISPKEDEYFERIDARMREVFPDKFTDTSDKSGQDSKEDTPSNQKPRPSTVVAPVERTPQGKKKVVLTKSQVAIAKKLGVSPEAYAREMIKQQEG